MNAVVYKHAMDVDRRLRELGLSRDELLEVVLAAVLGKSSCTDNDPPGAFGWMAWKEGCRRFRELFLSKKGFARSNDEGVPWVVDVIRSNRFTVANTDEGTGLVEPHRQPQQCSKKGPATDRAVSANQLSLFESSGESPLAPSPISYKRQPNRQLTWYLCIYSEGDVVRAELVCPKHMDGGYFLDFYERIIILGPGDDLVRTVPDKGAGESTVEEYNISVSRKKK